MSLKSKTISTGVLDILNIDGGIDASTAKQVKDGNAGGTPLYLTTTKVGIGVSSPSDLLDVNGTVRAKSLRLDEAANVNEGTITNTSVAGYSRLKAATSSGDGSTGVLIKGLDGGVEGQVLYIYKTSNEGILRIYNNSTNAAAGDKILVPGCVATDDSDYIEIPAGGYGGFTLVYDTSASEAYWHLITSAPNATIAT
tara:strand:+ start:887 stop:1477 length:591 start_codon:yes stop_codon:yes gene_type:complete